MVKIFVKKVMRAQISIPITHLYPSSLSSETTGIKAYHEKYLCDKLFFLQLSRIVNRKVNRLFYNFHSGLTINTVQHSMRKLRLIFIIYSEIL